MALKEIQYLQVSDLHVSKNNPRKITKKQVDLLRASLEEDPTYLERRPILVALMKGKYIIYAGTQRFLTIKEMGETKVPCFVEENLSKEDFDRRMLLDNAHYGHWSFDAVMNDFKDFSFKDSENPKIGDLHDFVEGEKYLSVSAGKTEKFYVYELEFENEEGLKNFIELADNLAIEYPNKSVTARLEAYLRDKYAEELY